MSSFRKKRVVPKKQYPAGTINLSQSINTFGIGSMLEVRSQKSKQTRTTSAIVSGLDFWREDKLENISEIDLCRLLEVKELKSPPSGDNNDYIPAKRFPRWLECSSCHYLGVIGTQFDEKADGIPSCASSNCNGWGVPTRLISVCYSSNPSETASEYHLDDFPWIYWAHKNNDKCSAPRVRVSSDGKKTGLDGMILKCDCGAKNSLQGALGSDALKNISCNGNSPWLNSRKECDKNIRALLRGASNVYFPVTASTISIPPNSSRLVQLLQSLKYKEFTTMYTEGRRRAEDVADMLYEKQDFSSLEPDAITKALKSLKEAQSSARTEAERKTEEREALIRNYPAEDIGDEQEEGDFEVEKVSLSQLDIATPGLSIFINNLSLVHRLREVIAFRGFTRLESPITANHFSVKCAPISNKKLNWLPAIENRGEGIYFELNNESLKEWESKLSVQKRIGILKKNYLRSTLSNAMDGEALEPTARLILLHTLSHLLIRQLSLECGYSSASLKERLYFSEGYCGVLISTASAASDGTLGGLVRQGKPNNFVNTLFNALYEAEWCSSDPLCIDSEGQGSEALNLASCHACGLISETSCALRNMFLDRALLIGQSEGDDVGFFSPLLC
ncbi:DUF1998 domain-containing protein [Pseudoalteromonas sp. S4741]|uniref:DUF1998 domain-containing protein n=1 Tax=Pseudoalteromonas sp. S4741 TaxID=579563 RepID=UPI00110C15E5|nr:DUF1998 domain-containing protein [Pseudoalteromonas sp. S4741]TMO22376.1 hypothetical protein CWC30_11155 [Pseudoalteromonas sp. S4741]